MSKSLVDLYLEAIDQRMFDDLAVWIKRTWYASDPSRHPRPAESPAAGD